MICEDAGAFGRAVLCSRGPWEVSRDLVLPLVTIGMATPRGPRRGRLLAAALLGGLLLAWPMAAAGQEPEPGIQIAPDEKDFEGFTSLALGSGARAFGMGGAFLARADDATAASWNPAGLSYLRKPELAFVGARSSFGRGLYGSERTDTFTGYTLDFASLAHPLSLGPLTGAVQLSYQRVFSFTGRRRIKGTPDFITEGRGGFDVLALGTGLKVSRTLRVGATLNRWLNGYHQDRIRNAVLRGESRQQIDYSLRGWNGNIGVMWSPWESLNVGLVGKTPFTGRMNLERLRTDFSLSDPTVGTANKHQSDEVRLDFPGAAGIGLSWRPRATLTLSADYTHTFWSHGRINKFFTLRGVNDPEGPGPDTFNRLLYPTLDDEDQTDTQQIRLGAEHVILMERIKVPVRAGAFTDRQYFRSGSADRQPPWFLGFTAGAGVVMGPLLLDVAYVYERGRYLSPEPSAAPEKVTTGFRRFFLSVIFRPGPER
jgi:hypothetical protein